jgi:hypothetical protein
MDLAALKFALEGRCTQCPMRKSILVKPDLKLIVLGALLIAVLHDVFTKGMSETAAVLDHQYPVCWVSDTELTRLIEKVDATPHSSGYLLISEAFDKRGDKRQALYFLRKAEAISPTQDWED